MAFEIHFLTNNTIEYSALGSSGFVTFSIVNGQLSTTPADYTVYSMLTDIHQYVQYSNNAVFLVGLWFDPAVEITSDVTSLPYMLSIKTEEGKATITYKWPS